MKVLLDREWLFCALHKRKMGFSGALTTWKLPVQPVSCIRRCWNLAKWEG